MVTRCHGVQVVPGQVRDQPPPDPEPHHPGPGGGGQRADQHHQQVIVIIIIIIITIIIMDNHQVPGQHLPLARPRLQLRRPAPDLGEPLPPGHLDRAPGGQGPHRRVRGQL